MNNQLWCEHLDKASKYTLIKYYVGDKEVVLRVQTWFCSECGIHGSQTEVINEEQPKIQLFNFERQMTAPAL
ncbi:hypothetical protein EV210_12423 [Anaerospora hongkongensis]|uniref:Uncharacterized protein n=1 Tax=Anaerospora hongkongensis TaxID=244830 RepID=A0A4R1PQY4_9FIRM|nr:hypothetical protein [Anaerospora hongkongensis]TCL32165.1 hypothetical protein EV210_12423 [Anaerospora hongkongensis]